MEVGKAVSGALLSDMMKGIWIEMDFQEQLKKETLFTQCTVVAGLGSEMDVGR